MTETRHRVPEWRVTHKIGDAEQTLTVRWWIEASPEYGGLATIQEARARATAVLVAVHDAMTDDEEMPVDVLVLKLLNQLPAANSVEVVDEHGDGMTIHADWP